MARLIDSSFKDAALTINRTWLGALIFRVQIGWKSTKYCVKDIKSVATIDEENYRSAGKAAAGAIIGGVLTGGVGLVAGAAIGGRRRGERTFLIAFNDGQFIAFSEKKRANIKAIESLITAEKIAVARGKQLSDDVER